MKEFCSGERGNFLLDIVPFSHSGISSTDIIGEIAAAPNKQSKGIDQVGQAVNQMDEVTQHNAALVEQTAAAAQSLDDQTKKLHSAISIFKF